MKEIIETFTETTWREWLAIAAEFSSAVAIVALIAVFLVAVAPEPNW